MKKSLLTLAGTAALFSALTLSAGAQVTTVPTTNTHLSEKVVRRNKKGHFSQINPIEKSELEEKMAADLSQVLGLSKEMVLKDLQFGKTPKDIIVLHDKSEKDVQEGLMNLTRERMKTKLLMDVSSGKVTQGKADEILKKISSERASL